MKKRIVTIIIIAAAFSLTLAAYGCGSSGKSSGGGGGIPAGGGTGGGGGGTGGGNIGGGTATISDGSSFPTVQDMYDYINATRQSYMHHDRWKGMPWEGDYHNNITWPSSHSWSDSLADQAQADADRLAGGGGGSPKGMPARFSQGMYIDGLGAANYQVTGLEKDGVQHDFLHKSGTARMAIHYYDPGEGPVLRQIGIGAADTGNGSTYWILLYGE